MHHSLIFMAPLLLITLCVETFPPHSKKGGTGQGSFHFIGAWNGHFIKRICLRFPHHTREEIQAGQEYIILMDPVKVEHSTLFGEIKKISPLSSLESLK